jgi:hypothetical protein
MKERDELWWANLDGEISPSEATEYDRCLSQDERRQNMDDLRMEAELAEILGVPVQCPDEVWRTALARVKEHEHAARVSAKRRGMRRWFFVIAPAALAATLAVFVFFHSAPTPPPILKKPVFLAIEANDVSGFAARSQITNGVEGARSLVKKRAPSVDLDPKDPFDGAVTPYRLLGAREDAYNGEQVVQLLFDCKGEPAMVVIAREQGAAAKEIANGLAEGTVSSSRAIGDVLVAVVGAHAPSGLLSVLSDKWSNPAEEAPPSPLAAPEEQPTPNSSAGVSSGPSIEENSNGNEKGLTPDSVLPETPEQPTFTPSPASEEPPFPKPDPAQLSSTDDEIYT